MVFFQYTEKYFGKRAMLSLLLFLFLLPVTILHAETRYVSDQLTINIKDKIEQPYTVVAKVRSNDAVNVLEESDGYTRIETVDKQIGWIASQYLTTTLPKTVVIDRLQKEIDSLLKQHAATNNSAVPPAKESQILNERDRLQIELEAARGYITELQKKLTTQVARPALPGANALSSEIQNLVDKRTKLESEIAALRVQIKGLNDGRVDIDALVQEKKRLVTENREKDKLMASLASENSKLARKTMIYWFVSGSMVFLAGMFSGKLFSKKKAKYSY